MPRLITGLEPARIARNLERVREAIAGAGRDPATVDVLAAAKYVPLEEMDALRESGLTLLGENRAQELEDKATLHPGFRWHFIGQLQSRKVRTLVGVVDVWQTVDRPVLVDELAKRAPGARVMVQVNVTDEPQKAGCAPGDAPALVAAAREAGLAVDGLMTVGRAGPPEGSRAGFRELRALADRLGVRHCSMGMSEDLEVAVASGSTMVRVGTALFGHRPPPLDPPK